MSTYYAVSKTTKEHFLAKSFANEDLNDAEPPKCKGYKLKSFQREALVNRYKQAKVL